MSTDALRRIVLDTADADAAVLLSEEAGWNQTRDDWAVFIAHGTVFGVWSGGRLVATAAVLPYGADFAWVAMVLVTAAFRRRGLGTRLVADCAALVREAGRAALLDATEYGAPVYAALGFSVLGGLTRWAGEGSGEAMPCDPIPYALDRAAFGADRRFLVDDFVARPGGLALVAGDGFAVLRPGRRAFHAGPLVGGSHAAEALLDRVIRAAPGSMVIDVLDGGGLEPALRARGFQVQRRFHRMGLDCAAVPGEPGRLFAAAGPEFG